MKDMLSNLLIENKIIIFNILCIFIGYFLGDKNNLRNKKRELILKYRIENFMKLALAVQRKPESGSQYLKDIEDAITNIELLGSKNEIDAIKKVRDEWSKTNKGNFDQILKILRDSLRKELQFEPIEEEVKWFRTEGRVV